MSEKPSSKKLIQAFKNKGKSLEAEMSFFEHLEVLRWHILRSCIAVGIFLILAFVFYDFIFNSIIMGPKHPDFWTYRMMCKIGEVFNIEGFCVTEIPGEIINTQMAGQFIVQINSALLISVMLGFPYLLYEVWLFVKPALTEIERKSASGFVLFATILFILSLLSISFFKGMLEISSIVKLIVALNSFNNV